MKKIALLIVLVACSLSSSCKTGAPPDGGGGGTPGVVSGVVDCAEQAVHAASLSILGDAASALATGNWQGALADLVGKFGEAAVDCAVREIGAQSNHNAMASKDPLEASKAERARLWLESRPVVLRN